MRVYLFRKECLDCYSFRRIFKLKEVERAMLTWPGARKSGQFSALGILSRLLDKGLKLALETDIF